MNRFIVDIVSPGHSGSTLLGNVLGAHRKGIHIGELVSPLKKGKPVVCRSCINDPCPVWGTVLTETFVKKVYQDFTSGNFLSRLLNAYPGSIYNKIFDAFKNVDFIVDSSKNIPWYKYNNRNRYHRKKYIFLRRNPSAILAAFKRAYKTDVKEYLPVVRRTIDEISLFYTKLPHADTLAMDYEAFVTNPVVEIQRLCIFLEIPYDPEMLNFNMYKQHLIGGNHGMLIQNDHTKIEEVDKLIDYKTPAETVEFYKSLNGFQLDERWKTELTQSEKYLIESEFKESC